MISMARRPDDLQGDARLAQRVTGAQRLAEGGVEREHGGPGQLREAR
jgi:hypothetical protein